ncbi:mediator of RNA polymerase II transcription subunit 19 [Eurytemora carolleeae]|uniref:mediator of RNA polymerase II transcription subunit 19 n=1 Tax=Eurytemora carolleeae TaxID=1294199 RepID=UPI000C76CF73|nr:mediator of RNA polymerase II transcription subunit 19 [Eurytemora carolleeae]|eukprot:XP_023348431.1 mediator of RNA polymerase II transcription subunit 19-like [Eurytemora affinis]
METFSPKNSPSRGSSSPSINSTDPGMLKVKLQINKPLPFYLLKPDNIAISDVTGATNLMASRNLEHSFNKLASKKMKDSLSSFLPGLPGIVDTPGSQDNSSLRGLIEKPPVGGKELTLLNQLQLTGFRLHPGPLPEQYRAVLNHVAGKEKKRTKKRKSRGTETPAQDELRDEERDRKRERKHKKHDKESEERRKKKKEKKKKKYKDEKDM